MNTRREDVKRLRLDRGSVITGLMIISLVFPFHYDDPRGSASSSKLYCDSKPFVNDSPGWPSGFFNSDDHESIRFLGKHLSPSRRVSSSCPVADSFQHDRLSQPRYCHYLSRQSCDSCSSSADGLEYADWSLQRLGECSGWRADPSSVHRSRGWTILHHVCKSDQPLDRCGPERKLDNPVDEPC